MKFSILAILFILFVSFQCTKDLEDPIADQEILFAKIYENHAWANNFSGWIIDNAGYIRGFSLQRNPDLDWKKYSDSGFNTAEELFYNIMQTDTTLTNISLSELFKYYQLIEPASKGVLSESESGGADMGQNTYFAIQYFPELKSYRWIVLNSEGDFQVHNISPEAGKIYHWLKQVDQFASSK